MKSNRYKLLVILFCLLLLLSSQCFAYTSTGTELANHEKIDEYINTEMQAIRIPGLSVGIVENGNIIYLKGYGFSDSKGTAVTPNTNFYIGSITKSFTALAARQLISEGRMDERAPVIKYLPWFRTNYKVASDKILVKDVINHTSGFSEPDGMAFVSNFSKETLEQSIRNLDKVKLKNLPGSKYEYSNINYSILGLIVEKVSNESYSEYMSKNIFKPLTMHNTFVVDNEDLTKKIATSHKVGFGIAIPTRLKLRLNTVPSGYISSSAEDMCSYMAAYIENGVYNGKSLIANGSPPCGDLVKSIKGGNQLHYDMYWNPTELDLKLKNDPTGFTGAFPCTMAEILIYPGRHLGIVALANSRNDSVAFIHDITAGIADILEGGNPVTASHEKYDRNSAIVVIGAFITGLLIFLHLLLTAIFVTRKLRRGIKPSVLNIISCIIIDFIIPLGILQGFPLLIKYSKHLDYNWSGLIFDGVQELLYVHNLSWILLGVGIIRLLGIALFAVLRASYVKKIGFEK